MIRDLRPHELFALVRTDSYADRLIPFVLPDDHTPKLLESAVLACLSRWAQPDLVMEFGTGRGIQTLQLAQWNPRADILTVDIGDPRFAAPSDRKAAEIIDREAGSGCKAFSSSPYAWRISETYGDSRQMDFEDYYGRAGLVYIDGGHAYEVVVSDSANAFRLIEGRPRATIVWHDYANSTYPGVRRCLDLVASREMLYHVRDTSMVVYLQGVTL